MISIIIFLYFSITSFIKILPCISISRKDKMPIVKIKPAKHIALISLIRFSLIFTLDLNHPFIAQNHPKDASFQLCSVNWEIDAEATVTYIVDGNTFDIDLGDRIRMSDIDTPGVGEAGYQEAKDYLDVLIYNKEIYLDIDDIYTYGPYGRVIAVTYVQYNSTHVLNVNMEMLDKNHAVIANYDNEFDPSEWELYYLYPEEGEDSNNDDTPLGRAFEKAFRRAFERAFKQAIGESH